MRMKARAGIGLGGSNARWGAIARRAAILLGGTAAMALNIHQPATATPAVHIRYSRHARRSGPDAGDGAGLRGLWTERDRHELLQSDRRQATEYDYRIRRLRAPDRYSAVPIRPIQGPAESKQSEHF